MSKEEEPKRPKLKGTWVNITDSQIEETNKVFESTLKSWLSKLNKELEEIELSNKDKQENGS